MSPIFASYNFTTEFTVWVVFLFVGLPVVIPTALLSHWLIRRYFVASLVGPAVLLLFSLAILPGTSATGEDYVILGYVVGMCFVTSFLSGLPFWISRQTKRRELQKPITDASAQSSGDPIPPA